MTWLGKILAVMVFVMALVWVWLTAVTFATRTNWKTRYDEAVVALKKSEDFRAEENTRAQSRIAELEKKLVEERSRTDSLSLQNVSHSIANKQNSQDFSSLANRIITTDPTGVVLAANLQAALNELDSLRKRTESLENDGKTLRIDLQKALNAKQAAEAETRQALAREEDAQKRIDFLADEVQNLRALARNGGGGGGGGLPPFERRSPPLFEGTRGEVTAYEGGLVVISIGLDAQVNRGAVLEVSRLEGGGKFLGTVVVNDSYPKYAVASFKPVSGKAIRNLKPDELPKIGDRVEAPRGTRPGG